MIFLEIGNFITANSNLGIMSAFIIVIVLFNLYLSWKNHRIQQQILDTLFGTALEKDVDGEGLYQKVKKIENRRQKGEDK